MKAKKKRFLCEKASKIEGINHTRDVGTPNGAGHRFSTRVTGEFPRENLLCKLFPTISVCFRTHESVRDKFAVLSDGRLSKCAETADEIYRLLTR